MAHRLCTSVRPYKKGQSPIFGYFLPGTSIINTVPKHHPPLTFWNNFRFITGVGIRAPHKQFPLMFHSHRLSAESRIVLVAIAMNGAGVGSAVTVSGKTVSRKFWGISTVSKLITSQNVLDTHTLSK